MTRFSRSAKAQDQGKNNFAKCRLKELDTSIVGFNDVFWDSRITITVEDCPTMQDRDLAPYSFNRSTRNTGERTRALKVITEEMTTFCGASICNNCVYVGMESPVEVSRYRTSKLVAERETLEAQAALDAARLELGLPVYDSFNR